MMIDVLSKHQLVEFPIHDEFMMSGMADQMGGMRNELASAK